MMEMMSQSMEKEHLIQLPGKSQLHIILYDSYLDTNSYSSYIFRTLFTEGTDSDITIKGPFEFR